MKKIKWLTAISATLHVTSLFGLNTELVAALLAVGAALMDLHE